MLSYSHARRLMESCRNKANGKPLQNNTRLYERGSDETTYYVVRLHNTDIVEIYSNGTYGIRHDGWTTVTTRDRIYGYSPLTWQQLQSESGDWYLRVRAGAGDPEPPSNNHIEVTKPYAEPPRPGDEPQSEDYGACWVGHRHSYTHRATKLAEPGDHVAEGTQYAPYDGWEDEPTAARRVLAYMPSFKYTHSVRISYLETVVVDYGEESYAFGRSERTKYEQCPHCKAYRSAHASWDVRRRTRERWEQNVAHYGSYDAWRAAWREDRQAVIDANRLWRAWNERNRVPWDGLVIVNSDGWPLWSEVKAVRSAQAARRRSEIRARKAREAAERERRQIERFKASVRRRRKPTFEQRAAEVARELSQLNANLKVAVSINDSSEE